MINKLVEKIKKLNAPIVVGLDPMLNYVPEFIQKKAFDEYDERVLQKQYGSLIKELLMQHTTLFLLLSLR